MIATIIRWRAAVSRGHAWMSFSRRSSDWAAAVSAVIFAVVAFVVALGAAAFKSSAFKPKDSAAHRRAVDPVVAGSSPSPSLGTMSIDDKPGLGPGLFRL